MRGLRHLATTHPPVLAAVQHTKETLAQCTLGQKAWDTISIHRCEVYGDVCFRGTQEILARSGVGGGVKVVPEMPVSMQRRRSEQVSTDMVQSFDREDAPTDGRIGEGSSWCQSRDYAL